MSADPNIKRAPQPVRFNPDEETLLRELADQTDLSLASVIRRSVAYAVPLFLSGKVNILRVRKPAKTAKK